MARDSKHEVAAINIRIAEEHDRNYLKLIKLLSGLRRGVRVYGDTYLAISQFWPEQNIGIVSKYTELDIDGDWFNLDDFDAADADQLENINIPENLKPNLAQFYFELDSNMHILVFSSYAESKGLSTRSMANYFREALLWPEIIKSFGRVESDIVQSYRAVEELFELIDLKEIRILIRRPNPDDVSEDLAAIIEERLRAQNGDEYEEVLRSKDSGNLKPDERTRRLGNVAAENGEVQTKSLVNGVMMERKTSHTPLKEVIKNKTDQAELVIFKSLSRKIRDIIDVARKDAH